MIDIITDNRLLLHKLVDEADEKLIKMLIALTNEYNNDFELTEEEIKEIEDDIDKIDRGELKTYKWDEIKDIALGKKTIDEL